jgi:hypothetical protein
MAMILLQSLVQAILERLYQLAVPEDEKNEVKIKIKSQKKPNRTFNFLYYYIII